MILCSDDEKKGEKVDDNNDNDVITEIPGQILEEDNLSIFDEVTPDNDVSLFGQDLSSDEYDMD